MEPLEQSDHGPFYPTLPDVTVQQQVQKISIQSFSPSENALASSKFARSGLHARKLAAAFI
jgi:hypothetical protein